MLRLIAIVHVLAKRGKVRCSSLGKNNQTSRNFRVNISLRGVEEVLAIMQIFRIAPFSSNQLAAVAELS